MFGKRKQDRKHRFDEEGLDDTPDDELRPLAEEDSELTEALLQLGLNRHAPLVDPPDEGSAFAAWSREPSPQAPNPLDRLDVPDEPDPTDESAASGDADERSAADERDAENLVDADESKEPRRFVVPTAAMLAEPEPTSDLTPGVGVGQPEPIPVAEDATHAALRRERAKAAEREAALRKAEDEAQQLRAELKRLQAAATSSGPADVQATTARTDELEKSLRTSQERVEELTTEVETLRAASSDVDAAGKTVEELQTKVATLTAELEQSRADAAAAGVALERIERESQQQDGAAGAAEERVEQLTAEVERLRAELAKGPAKAEQLQRDADRESAMRVALEQAQASQAQAEAALAENRRLSNELAANLKSQEGLIFALTGLQTELTEQRAWFESQIASVSQAESQHTGVVEALQTAIHDRDVELQMLREQLLEAEAKRAEEAAAFVAALESQ